MKSSRHYKWIIPTLFSAALLSSCAGVGDVLFPDGNNGQGGGNNPPVQSPDPSDPGNNPGNPSDPTCGAATPGYSYPGTILIDDGATATRNLQVTLRLDRFEAQQMRISNTPDCTCGDWEDFAPEKTWTLAKENAQNTVSVQYRDLEGLTQCASASILHDNLPPVITITADPQNSYIAGSDTRFSFSITDSGVGTGIYDCSVNNAPVPCRLGSNNSGEITVPRQTPGNYELKISASDKLGSTSEAKQPWEIKQALRPITQDYDLQGGGNKVDILFVIDNSPSMKYEQKSMAARMSSFMKEIDGVDYTIAVTTTDPKNSVNGDGRLIPLVGLNNEYILTPAVGIEQGQKILGATLQKKANGSSVEKGIFATYRSIERHFDTAASPNKKFFRDDASFATVVISDENETGTDKKSKPEALLSLVKNKWPGKNFTWHSIITIPGDEKCLKSNGYSYGVAYEKLSKLTGQGKTGGAVIGTVCATDYGSQLKGIGGSVGSMPRVIELQCPAVGDPASSVIVTRNGAAFNEPYQVEGSRLVFANPLPAGQYQLKYNCL